MPNPWDNDPIVGTHSAGGPVYGPPPSQAKVNAEARAQQDQALQIEAAQRAAAAEARASRAEARAQREFDATHDPKTGAPLPNRQNQPTEFQSKSAGFLGRLLQAERDYNAVPAGSRDARTFTGQKFHDWAPDIENSIPTWMGGNSVDRQKSDQAARNFISASLRQESGAAINETEFMRQYQIFFPQPGDTPDVIDQKRQARMQAIEGFKAAAGPVGERIVASAQRKQWGDLYSSGAGQRSQSHPPDIQDIMRKYGGR